MGVSLSVKVGKPGPGFLAGVSGNGKYLLNQYGQPYLMNLYLAWGICGAVMDNATVTTGQSDADQLSFIQTIVSGGFNTIHFSIGSGVDSDGNSPYTDSSFTPNSAYWARIDTLLSQCRAHGLSVILDVLDSYAFLSGQQFTSMTTAQATAYGVFLANRYPQSLWPGIMWFFGNDYAGGGAGLGNSTNLDSIYTAFLGGVASKGDTRIWTVELGYPDSSTTDSTHTFAESAPVNCTFTYRPTYAATLRSVAASAKPTYYCDGASEDSQYGSYPGTPLELRKAFCWVMTSGASGAFFTNDNVWSFASGYKTHLGEPGMQERQVLFNVFNTTKWWNMAPDVSSHLVTAGRNTIYTAISTATLPATTDATYGFYVTACYSADGKSAMVYNPDSSVNTSITLSTTPLGTSPTLTRVDPSTGVQTPMTWTTTLTNPGANNDGDHDWLYLITAS